LPLQRKFAAARSQSLGKVVSELAMHALKSRIERGSSVRGGFPVFKVRKGAALISLEDIKRDEDLALPLTCWM
jgi:hypothetical protein